MENTVVIACPKCARKLHVPADSGPCQVICVGCQANWQWPEVKQFPPKPVDERNLNNEDGSTRAVKLTYHCEECDHPIRMTGEGPHHVVCTKCGADNGTWELQTDTSDLPKGVPDLLNYFQNSGINLSKGVWCKRSSLPMPPKPVSVENIQADRSVEASSQQSKSPAAGMNYPTYPEFPRVPAPSEEGSEGEDQMVSFIEFNPSDFTRAGWALFLGSYMAIVFILCCIIAMVGKQMAGRIGFKLFWVVFTILPFGLGMMLFYTGKWLLEKKCNIRVIKRTPSEAACWSDPDVAHNVVIALGILVPVAIFFYIQVFMD
jgi:hypothetical protein